VSSYLRRYFKCFSVFLGNMGVPEARVETQGQMDVHWFVID